MLGDLGREGVVGAQEPWVPGSAAAKGEPRDEVLAVDGESKGPADLRVGQRAWLGQVEVEGAGRVALLGDHAEPGVPGEAGQGVRPDPDSTSHVGGAGEQAGELVVDLCALDPGDVRPTEVVVVLRHVRQRLAVAPVRLEAVGAGPDQHLEVLFLGRPADGGPHVLRDDRQRPGHLLGEGDVRPLQGDLDRPRAGRSDLGDPLRALDGDRRRQDLLGVVVEGEHDVGWGHRPAVAPPRGLTELEGVGEVVGRRGGAGGQPGQEPTAAVLPEEGVVDEAHLVVAEATVGRERRREPQSPVGEPHPGPRCVRAATGPTAGPEGQGAGATEGTEQQASAVDPGHDDRSQRGLNDGSSPTPTNVKPMTVAAMPIPAGSTHHVHIALK